MSKHNKNKKDLLTDTKTERHVLAFCISNFKKEGLRLCVENKMHPRIFFKTSHQLIFKVLLYFYNKNIPLDINIIIHELNLRGNLDLIGGEFYLRDMVTEALKNGFVGINWYLKHLKKLFILRTLVAVSSKTIDLAYNYSEKPTHTLISSLKKKINELEFFNNQNTTKHCSDVLKQIVKVFNSNNLNDVNKTNTGFNDLDSITGGFSKKDMIIIAARPSIGKTSLALNIVESFIKLKSKRVVFFSLEMSAEHLLYRLICSISLININSSRGYYTKGQFNQLNNSIKKIKNSLFWVDDFSNSTIEEIRSKSRKIAEDGSLDLIIIDYLQLVRGSGYISREQQVSEISRNIKDMAKELNVPVVVLSQLNRESEREGRKPKLSDLRESGSIEQDSDLVLILNNKESYETNSSVVRGSSSLTLKELVVAKNRNGPTGKITLVFNNLLTKFENYYEYKDY